MFTKIQHSIGVRVAFVLLLLIGSVLTTTPVHAGASILYVNQNAGGANNGTSWANAYTSLQSALAAASSGSEIWVAAGTYKPTTGTDRMISFALKNGVRVYGGFAGTETLLNQRNPAVNTTILSGDIGVVSDASDNSYHVVSNLNLNNTAVLDGFTLQDGNANGFDPLEPTDRGGGIYNFSSSPVLSNLVIKDNSANSLGGGIYNDQSSPILTNVTFSYNQSHYIGGGMFNHGGSSPILTNSVFSNNNADFSGGGMANAGSTSNPSLTDVTFALNSANNSGGGMSNSAGSNPVLTRVIFEGNIASSRGGGMRNLDSSPLLVDVTFKYNDASSGGGMENLNSSPVLTNVTFSENVAGEGGGMRNMEGSHAQLTNVTFSGNSAVYGGGLFNHLSNPLLKNVTIASNSAYSGGGVGNSSSNPTMSNVIIWGNTASSGAQIYDVSSSPSVTYSIVQGGYTGVGNLDVDPLLGPLQDNGGFTETLALAEESPAVDAGENGSCPAADQRGMPRPQGAGCDIGAYELGGIFWDVPLTYWSRDYIERLYKAGVTGGCSTSPLKYCPGHTVTRDQMAVFLLRAKYGSSHVPPSPSGVFTDVPTTYWAAGWIEELASEGITGGCAAGKYCPGNPVTRAQMAVFLLRAKYGADYTPPQATGVFADVPVSHWTAPWIEQLADEGITGGCGGAKYCPNNPVTRDQMAVFLVRTFNLSTPEYRDMLGR